LIYPTVLSVLEVHPFKFIVRNGRIAALPLALLPCSLGFGLAFSVRGVLGQSARSSLPDSPPDCPAGFATAPHPLAALGLLHSSQSARCFAAARIACCSLGLRLPSSSTGRGRSRPHLQPLLETKPGRMGNCGYNQNKHPMSGCSLCWYPAASGITVHSRPYLWCWKFYRVSPQFAIGALLRCRLHRLLLTGPPPPFLVHWTRSESAPSPALVGDKARENGKLRV